MPPHPNSLANLRPPWKPGEAPNPEGKNQYTARREAAKSWDKIALAVHGDRRRLDAFLEKVWAAADRGEPWAAKEILCRILPAVQKHEVQLPTNGAAKIEVAHERMTEVGEILAEETALH